MAKNRREAKRIREQISKKRTQNDKALSSGDSKRRNKAKNRGKTKRITIEDLKVEYAYVLKDLYRIFILAGAMFVLLIGANLLFPILFG